MKKTTYIVLGAVMAVSIFASERLPSQNLEDLNRLAQEHYDNRDFTRALETWMLALEQDPENERIQKKIELVYEEKYKRDVAYQKARINYRQARNKIKIDLQDANLEKAIRDFNSGKKNAEMALQYFFIAYRIDPNDDDLRELREAMKELDKDVRLAEEKIALDLERRKKYREFMDCAEERMDNENYAGSIECWEGVLAIVPLDKKALEGKRRAEMALNNRLKFEKITNLLKEGKILFDIKKYFDSRSVYKQVLNLDPNNGDAKDQIREIDEKLNEARFAAQKRQQAEGFYVSGLKNLRENKFDLAEDEFRNVIDLMRGDYKDTQYRLASIKGLRKEYQEFLRRKRIKEVETEIDKGMIAYAEARYNDAISSFEQVLKLDPENELARKQLAISKDAQKIDAEEIVDENSPYFDIVGLMIVSGKELYMNGDYRGSRQKWEQILQLFPRNKIASAYMLRVTRTNPEEFNRFSTKIVNDGKDYLKIRNYDRAREKFELVKSINPDFPNIDTLITSTREPQQIRRIVDANVTPEEIQARYNMGLNYYRRGGIDNMQKALNEFKWVSMKDPDNTRAIINLNKIQSILRISSGQVEVGKEQLSPEQQSLVRQFYYKGISYYSNNDFARAIQEWRKVLAIDRYHQRAKNNIRKCLVLLRK